MLVVVGGWRMHKMGAGRGERPSFYILCDETPMVRLRTDGAKNGPMKLLRCPRRAEVLCSSR